MGEKFIINKTMGINRGLNMMKREIEYFIRTIRELNINMIKTEI